MIPAAKQTFRALLGACACALLLALPAPAATRTVAATPCWKSLINEWYGGSITHIYAIPCYQQAINHLPSGDLGTYSSIIEDIERARRVAIAYEKNPKGPTPTVTNSQQPGVTTTDTKTVPGRVNPPGISGAIIDSSSGGATSFPLPLIILGGLAIFLLAAGGVGLIVRRMQDRGGPGTA